MNTDNTLKRYEYEFAPVAGAWVAWFEQNGVCVGFEDTEGRFYGWDDATNTVTPPD